MESYSPRNAADCASRMAVGSTFFSDPKSTASLTSAVDISALTSAPTPSWLNMLP